MMMMLRNPCYMIIKQKHSSLLTIFPRSIFCGEITVEIKIENSLPRANDPQKLAFKYAASEEFVFSKTLMANE